jgi:DnaJ-class molecular chaperone
MKNDEPKPSTCWKCSGMGYRGMDRCNWCDTTGSVFRVGGMTFPNTKEGFEQACQARRSPKEKPHE